MEPTVFTASLPAFTHNDESLTKHAQDGGLKIEEVDLVGASKVTNAGIQAVATHCPNIVRINLCGCTLVGDAGVTALAERCTKLEALLLSGVLVSDAALAAVAAHTPLLHDLDLSCCRAAPDPALPDLLVLEGQPNLSRVTDAGLAALADGVCGATLKSVSLAFCSHVTGTGLSLLSRSCGNLMCVNLGDLPLVDEEGLTALAAHCAALSQVEVGNCPGLTDAAVQRFLRLPSLRSLNVSGGRAISDAAFADVQCPTLHRLGAGHVGTPLSDATVVAIAAGCPDLLELDLGGSAVTDVGLVRLSSQCGRLVKVGLRRCKKITDAGLGFLSDRAKFLQWIDLSLASRKITEGGILSLAEGCGGLKFVGVSGLSWIREDFIEEMEDERGVRVYDDGGLYEEEDDTGKEG